MQKIFKVFVISELLIRWHLIFIVKVNGFIKAEFVWLGFMAYKPLKVN